MAFKEKEIQTSCVLLFLATVISQMRFLTATNHDCKGKAFYCLNSTHFMICLDLGDGISTTVEDFVIPCPPPTICIESNDFECEYHPTTALKPIIQTEVPVTELNVQTWRGDSDYTTSLPFWYNTEDYVKSEKYYDMLDDQPNLLATEYTQIPEITYTSIQHQSTTETEIINELNIETTTLTQEENNSLTPTIYSVAEEITLSTDIANDDKIEASSQLLGEDSKNAVSDGYDHHFDTVSTTTLSESTTQTTMQYNEIESSTYNLDEYIPSKEETSTPPVLYFYTYQEEATTHPQEKTLTTDLASAKLKTTLQEREEIKETTSKEISYSVTTETEKYLNTNSDYVYKISSISTFQEAEMLNEVTNTEMNYGQTTERNNYINNNTFVTTTPLITFQEKSELLKNVVINNTSDAMQTSEVFTNYNSLTTLSEEKIEIDYRKTEDTEVNYGNTVETNYPITTEMYDYINTVSVSTTEKYTINEDYRAIFPKSTTSIDESSTIDIKYITRPYASQILNNDISQIKNMDKESTYYPINFSPNANVNITSKNTQDITSNNNEIYLDFRVNEMPFQTDENFSEILQTTSKVPVTDYMMQDTISPFDYTETIHNVKQQFHTRTEKITEFDEYVSSTTKDKLIEINVELTVQLDYQIATDSSLLSPIEEENKLHTNIIENIIVPTYSAQDNVTEIKTSDTVILAMNNEDHLKQSNSKNQDKTNANFYTSFTQSYDPFSRANDYDSVMKETLPESENPKVTAFENYFKTMDTNLLETTSEQKNNDVHTFSIEDQTLTTVFTTSPLVKDLYNTENNNNQYEVTKEINVIYHDESPVIASTTPSIYYLKGTTIDNRNNLEKSVTEPGTEINSTQSMSLDRSSTNYTVTLYNEMFTTSYANNDVVNSSAVMAIANDVTSNLKDNEATESSINIQNIKQALEGLGPIGSMYVSKKNETKVTKDVKKITEESKLINTTNYEDKHSSMVGNTNSGNTPGKIPGITSTAINKLSTTVPPVPTIMIINGNKTVVIYSEDSKTEGTGDAIKLPDTVINNTNSKKNTPVSVSHIGKIVNDVPQNSEVPIISNASYIDKAEEMKSPSIALAHNISYLESKGKNITTNFQDTSKYKYKESVSVQTSERCNKTMPDTTTNQSNIASHPIAKEKLNFTCINRYRGKYSDQNNCQTFYRCIGTMSPIVGQCPQNSVFSDILNQCTRNLSHCIRNNQFQCVSSGRFSDLWGIDTYYICLRQNSKFLRFKLRCQKGYLLNRTSITCVKNPVKNSSFSLESYSTSSSSSSSADSKSEQIHSKNKENGFKCEKEGVFPDPNHCRKYYVCKKVSKSEIRLKKKKCDSDEVFNKNKKICVDEDSYEC